MMETIEKLKELYSMIPRSKCKDGCSKCCTNMIQFTPSEERNMGGYDYDGKCLHLIEGKCTVYDKRPLVCRIYGTSEMFTCEDCIPERKLSDEETIQIIHKYVIIKNNEERKVR